MGDSPRSDLGEGDGAAAAPSAIEETQSIDWKKLFERLPVILIVSGWMAYAASYTAQADFLWSIGFTPEQAGLSPGGALIRSTPGVLLIILFLGLAIVMSYVGVVQISREGWVSRLSQFWRMVAVAALLFVGPLVLYFFGAAVPAAENLRKYSVFLFGFFWAAGSVAAAMVAGLRGYRFLAVMLAVMAYGIGTFQFVVNADAAADATRHTCGRTYRPLLVGFNPLQVQVTWAKASDAPASIQHAPSKLLGASPGSLTAGMLLITDNGDQYLLYSCATNRSYTVEHSSASIEALLDD